MYDRSASFIIKLIRNLLAKSYDRSPAEQIKYAMPIINYIFSETILLKECVESDIVNYYTECFNIYTRFHSKDGAIHWRLNFDGKLKDNDVYNTPRLIKEIIDVNKSCKILELGVGKGFNLKYLSEDGLDFKLHGLDITPQNVSAAQIKVPNAEIQLGNFDVCIPFGDKSMDFIFNVESFCHSCDRDKFLSEVSRVLKDNGKLLIVDAFCEKENSLLSDIEKTARSIFYKSMICNEPIYVKELEKIANTYELKIIRQDIYSDETMLQSIKFEHFANNLCRFKWLLKEGLRRHSHMINFNLITALLARALIESKILSYKFLLFEKIS